MRTHFHNELADLERAVIGMGGDVCANVMMAVDSLRSVDQALAVQVMRNDRDIDLCEVRNEEACLKIIALHQPVADDLRYLVVMLKVNHELERISDLAVDLTETVHLIDPDGCRPWCDRFADLAKDAADRLRRVLDALVVRDAKTARDVWMQDEEIDRAADEMSAALQQAIRERTTDGGEALFAMLTAVGHVERLADHVKNIAKDIIYLVLGEIVRHRSQEFFGDDEKEAKTRVLFVCIHNRARSQMAEAWLNHLHGERFVAESAGLEPGELNPYAVAVMREVGIDIAGQPTRDVFEVVKAGRPFDYLITVCDEANAKKCPPVAGTRKELHWNFPDPASVDGDEAAKTTFARDVRDAIRRRLEAWIDELAGAEDKQ